jgi:hypothetical protein
MSVDTSPSGQSQAEFRAPNRFRVQKSSLRNAIGMGAAVVIVGYATMDYMLSRIHTATEASPSYAAQLSFEELPPEVFRAKFNPGITRKDDKPRSEYVFNDIVLYRRLADSNNSETVIIPARNVIGFEYLFEQSKENPELYKIIGSNYPGTPNGQPINPMTHKALESSEMPFETSRIQLDIVSIAKTDNSGTYK